MLFQNNGLVKKRVRVCFSLIRGSPLWEAYKKEKLIDSEKDRRVDRKFLTEVVNWMAGQNNRLWKALATEQDDDKLAVRFAKAIQENPIWVALQTNQITLNELEIEVTVCQSSRILVKREEEALLDILLEELSKV